MHLFFATFSFVCLKEWWPFLLHLPFFLWLQQQQTRKYPITSPQSLLNSSKSPTTFPLVLNLFKRSYHEVAVFNFICFSVVVACRNLGYQRMKKYLRSRESNEFVNKMCHRLKLNTQIDHEAIMAALDLRIEAPRDTIDRRQMFDVQS